MHADSAMKSAIIIGSESEIASDLSVKLFGAGWEVHGWKRKEAIPLKPWDLALFAVGRVAPVGLWHEQRYQEWAENIESNLLLPFRMLGYLWPMRRDGASVCFMAGSNPQRIMNGYSAYNTGKMALLKMVEQLDHETPDAKFFALGPGYIKTKIHDATICAGWPNDVIDSGREGGSMDDVYRALMWCVDQPKEVVGGRNICVSDIKDGLSQRLAENPDLFKLRRVE